jgi:6-phosphofructokinase 1
MRIGILTGGGDCPGLNAVIRATVRKAANEGHEVVGILDGWKGLIEGSTMDLGIATTDSIVGEGGTILGTSRTNPYKNPDDVKKVVGNFSQLGLDALIAVGGDDTLGVARKLYDDHKSNVVGVPKTIDNDLSVTDYTFGFDTAVNIATEAIDRIHTTAKSHHRCLVVEVMGRHAGWIAAYAGMAGGADYILVPEVKVDMEHLCRTLKANREAAGKRYNVVVASEGAAIGSEFSTKSYKKDSFGHVMLGGIGEHLAQLIEKKTGYETRSVTLGHIQRGGSPTVFDRVLGTRYGVKAVELVVAGEFGKMVALRGTELVSVSLAEATGETKTLDPGLFDVAREFFR